MTADDFSPLPPEEKPNVAALVLSATVHLLLIGALFFGVQWKSQAPSGVAIEVWRSTAGPAAVAKREPVPAPPPPKAEPKPEPKPEPQPEPVPEPKPVPRPEPKVVEPPQIDPQIAIKDKERREKEEKAKLEKERLEKEQTEKLKKQKLEEEQKRKEEEIRKEKEEKARKEEEEKKKREQKEKEARRAAELAKELEQDLKAAQRKAAAAQAEKSRNDALDAEFSHIGEIKGQQAAAARRAGEAKYIAALRQKIRGNIVLPPGIKGNPEAEFKITQLPTGQVIGARVSKSSGNRALDEAIERAIKKSDPLPLPDDRNLFQRELNLKYRPFAE